MTTKEEVIEILKTVVDPEIFIDIWTLGLIYDIEIQDKNLNLRMTFTSPACPAGPELMEEVRQKTVEMLPEIESTHIQIVFDPPWTPSEDLKAMMGIG